MKLCELCKGLARTYCESDQASLCWNCDVKVHGANFLVARHSRTVLCHACQSPTPWTASGAELGVTVSVCESCVIGGRNRVQAGDDEESQGGNDEDIDSDADDEDDDDEDEDENETDHDEEDYDDDEEEEDEEEEEEEKVGGDDEDGDNQVVPWSAIPSATPPPAASSSSSEESVTRFGNGGGEASEAFSLKRFREISSDPTSQDNLDRSPKRKYWTPATSPAGWSGAHGGDDSVESRPLKGFKTESEFPGQGNPSRLLNRLGSFAGEIRRNLSG